MVGLPRQISQRSQVFKQLPAGVHGKHSLRIRHLRKRASSSVGLGLGAEENVSIAAARTHACELRERAATKAVTAVWRERPATFLAT